VPIENKLGAHPKIEAVCVSGANQPATFALVLLSEDTRKALAANTLDRKTIEDDLAALLDQVNATVDPHEALEFIVVVNTPWTIDNGMLTPTMKIKRNVIEKRYEALIDRWFASRRKVIWE
jgi:long-chain acyl-CoA synthetase